MHTFKKYPKKSKNKENKERQRDIWLIQPVIALFQGFVITLERLL